MDFLNYGGRLRDAFAPKNPIPPYRPMDEIPRPTGIYDNSPHPLPKLFETPNIRETYERDALGRSQNDDILSAYERLYTPQHQYSDLYQKAIEEMPQREEPGKLRRVFGFMAGLGQGGPEAQERVKYAPYYRKIGDWNERIKALQPGMTAERAENVNERMLLQSAFSNLLRDKEIERKADLDRENTRIKDERAQAYAANLKFKQDNPDWDFVAIPGGNYQWIPPRPGMGNPVDSGMKSGSIGKIEEMNMQQKNALARIAAQGGETRKSIEARGDVEEGLIEARGAEARTTKAAPSDTGTETTATTEIVAKDEQGNPTKIERRQVRRPLPKYHRMQYTDKNTGKVMIVRVPAEKVKEAITHGAKDLGEISASKP